MKNLRDTIQLILVIIGFITFKRTTNTALQLTLYMVLNAIIIQEFMQIYNAERDRDKSQTNVIIDQYRYWRLAGIVLVELFVVATVYYLSSILIERFQNL
ncbi:MAG: hypothetical protein C0446_13850 [Chitinophaga sp.]|nr:hypothetical protein [Chitinophaga sp.]PJE46446.1 MAG: hypothetical protein CUR34_07335 [Sediminibacterium sp.] [Sediminibacterium sp. FEMGT703S]